jgi:mevalonate kinase
MKDQDYSSRDLTFIFHDYVSKKISNELLKKSFDKNLLKTLATIRFQEDHHYLPVPSSEILTALDEILAEEHKEDAQIFRPALYIACLTLRRAPSIFTYVVYFFKSILVNRNTNVSCSETWGSVIHIQGENFPPGAGLGSSAAFSVAMIRAFSSLTPGSQLNLENLNRYAFSTEVLLHGTPSGVDNTISTFGGTILFTKLPNPNSHRIQGELKAFHFLLVNTRVSRSTKEQVKKLRIFYESNQDVAEKLIEEVNQISHTFMTLCESKELTEEILAQMILRNEQILEQLGVGHEKIDQVVHITKSYGVTTKLTGAGGGGCTISLLPTSISESKITEMIQELEIAGFECFRSSLGGKGCNILEQ